MRIEEEQNDTEREVENPSKIFRHDDEKRHIFFTSLEIAKT